jgi:hypothetical protein
MNVCILNVKNRIFRIDSKRASEREIIRQISTILLDILFLHVAALETVIGTIVAEDFSPHRISLAFAFRFETTKIFFYSDSIQ